MRKITFLLSTLLLLAGAAVLGCGSSSGDRSDFVYTGTDNGGGGGSAPVQTFDVLLRVVVDEFVPGAQTVAHEADNSRVVALLKMVSSPAKAQGATYTLPGATVTAYDSAGQFVRTSTLADDGTVLFEDLPVGTYRFVVTTSDPAVVLQAVASSNGPSAGTRVDVESTVATLIALQRGNGGLDWMVYQTAVNATRSGSSEPASSAVSLVNSSLRESTAYLSSNGQSILIPALSTSINAAASQLVVDTGGSDAGIPSTTGVGTTDGGTNTGTTGGGTTPGGTTGGSTTPGGTTGGGGTNPSGTTSGTVTPGGTTGGGTNPSGTTGGGVTPGGTTGGGTNPSGTTGGGVTPGGTTGGGTNPSGTTGGTVTPGGTTGGVNP